VKADPLAELRDIHMPEPVSWWPPAPGWWLLLLIVLIIGALFWWWRRRAAGLSQAARFSRRDIIAAAMHELAGIEQRLTVEETSSTAIAAELSALLRRVGMQLCTAPEGLDAGIAGLSGDAWLQWLDSQWDEGHFCSETGRQLLEAPYRSDVRIDMATLVAWVRRWLQAQ